jgi:selenocysteine-specific elongation factor
MLASAGNAGLEITLLPIRTGFRAEEVQAAIKRLNATIAGDRVFASSVIGELEQTIAGFIALEMATHPLEAGVSLQKLRSSSKAPQPVIDLVLGRLCASGRADVDGSLVRPSGWSSKLNEREQSLSDAILHAICVQPLEPPSVGELQDRFGGSALALIRRLERQGELERVGEDRYYSRGAVEQMVSTLKSSLSAGRRYSPAELREVLGISRKYLIPFLEFCDRRGVTERMEAGRVIRRERD